MRNDTKYLPNSSFVVSGLYQGILFFIFIVVSSEIAKAIIIIKAKIIKKSDLAKGGFIIKMILSTIRNNIKKKRALTVNHLLSSLANDCSSSLKIQSIPSDSFDSIFDNTSDCFSIFFDCFEAVSASFVSSHSDTIIEAF